MSELGAQIELAAGTGDVAAIERWAEELSEYAGQQLGALSRAASTRPDSIPR